MELSREQILGADDLVVEEVDTPEWGGVTFVRMLGCDEYYTYSRGVVKDGVVIEANLITKYCSFVICNSKGERLFSDEDVEKLGRKYWHVLLRVHDAAKKLNGEDEDMVKNSDSTQSEDSSLD